MKSLVFLTAAAVIIHTPSKADTVKQANMRQTIRKTFCLPMPKLPMQKNDLIAVNFKAPIALAADTLKNQIQGGFAKFYVSSFLFASNNLLPYTTSAPNGKAPFCELKVSAKSFKEDADKKHFILQTSQAASESCMMRVITSTPTRLSLVEDAASCTKNASQILSIECTGSGATMTPADLQFMLLNHELTSVKAGCKPVEVEVPVESKDCVECIKKQQEAIAKQADDLQKEINAAISSRKNKVSIEVAKAAIKKMIVSNEEFIRDPLKLDDEKVFRSLKKQREQEKIRGVINMDKPSPVWSKINREIEKSKEYQAVHAANQEWLDGDEHEGYGEHIEKMYKLEAKLRNEQFEKLTDEEKIEYISHINEENEKEAARSHAHAEAEAATRKK